MKRRLFGFAVGAIALAGIFSLMGCGGSSDSTPRAFTVTVGTHENGTLTASPISAEAGVPITLTAVPNAGFEFDYWTITGGIEPVRVGTTNEWTFTMPPNNVTVNVAFRQSDLPPGAFTIGRGTPPPEGGSFEISHTTAEADDIITLTALPEEGFELHAWLITGITPAPVAGEPNRYTFVMPGRNITVNASFRPIGGEAPQYSITVGSHAGGTLSISHASASAGTEITVTATPGANYEFDRFYTHGVTIDFVRDDDYPNVWRFAMPGVAITIDAIFTRAYTVTLGTPANGTLTSSHVRAMVGATVTLTAAPPEHYDVYAWNIEPDTVVPVRVSGTNNWTFIMPPANVTVYVEFRDIRPPTFAITRGTPAPANGTFEISHYYAAEGTEITLTAMPNEGFELETWIITGIDPVRVGDTNQWTFEMPADNVVVNALFMVIGGTVTYFDIATGTPVNGALNITPDSAPAGTTITVTVTPGENFGFFGENYFIVTPDTVTVDFVQDADNPNVWTFAMPPADITVNATFERIFAITIGDHANGELTRAPERARAGTEITIIARPNQGFVFESLNVTGVENEDLRQGLNNQWFFDMPAQDVTVSAVFAVETFAIDVVQSGPGMITVNYERAPVDTLVTVTATPDAGDNRLRDIEFTWSGGVLVATPVQNAGNIVQHTFTMPAGPVTITATFEVYPFWPVTYAVDGGHFEITVVPNNLRDGTPVQVREGAPVAIELVLDGDHVSFVPSSLRINDGAITPTQNMRAAGHIWTFSMPAGPVHITAQTDITRTVTVGTPANGTLTANLAGGSAGTTVTLTAVPNRGYRLGEWGITPAEVVLQQGAEPNTWTFVIPADNVTVNVTFVAQDRHTVTVSPALEGGTVDVEPEHDDFIISGDTITLTLSEPVRGYRLPNAAGDWGIYPANLVPVRVGQTMQWTFTMPDANVTINEAFVALDRRTVTVSSALAGGTVDVEPEHDDFIISGDEITLTASAPVFGYRMLATWAITPAVEISGTGNARTFVMPDADVTINAVFEPLPTHEITVVAPERATVEADPASAFAGQTVTLTVNAEEGFMLYSWNITSTAINPERIGDTNQWTFVMVDQPVTVNAVIDYAEEVWRNNPWMIYSGGVRPGLDLYPGVIHGTLGAAWWGSAEAIAANTTLDHQFYNGSEYSTVIRHMGITGQSAFSLRSAEPIYIDSSQVVALSFLARASENVRIGFVGFGQPGTSRVMVGPHVEGNPTADNSLITTEWQRFIVPVPSQMAGILPITDMFFVRFGGAGIGAGVPGFPAGASLYLDEIEFLTSGVTKSMILPEVFGELPNLDPVNVAMFVNLVATRFQHTDGTAAIVRDVQWYATIGRTLIWDTWFDDEVEVRIARGAADIVNGTIVPRSLGAIFYVEAGLGGVWSNEMQVTVSETIRTVLHDFQSYPPLWTGHNGFVWRIPGPTGHGESAIPGSYRFSALIRRDPAGSTTPVSAWRFFDSVNIDGFDRITFAARQSADGFPVPVLHFALRSGADTWHYVDVGDAFNGVQTGAARIPQHVELSLSSFEGHVDLSDITGFRFTLPEGGGLTVADVFAEML